MTESKHKHWLRRCLELGANACSRVGSGAMVGAVLVRGECALAEAQHPAFGEFHAERMLLTNYQAPLSPDDTLYVNLEPCVPSPSKKTPACVDIIIERGVKRLVYGMVDPDERVRGKGVSILRNHGVEVEGPGLDEESRRFNRGFVSLRTKGRPWCGELHSSKALSIKRAAWCIGQDPQPYPAVLVPSESLLSVYERIAATTETLDPDARPWLVLIKDQDARAASAIEKLSVYARIILIDDASISITSKPGSCIRHSSQGLQAGLASVIQSLGSPSQVFAGISALLVLQNGGGKASLTAAGLIDEVL